MDRQNIADGWKITSNKKRPPNSFESIYVLGQKHLVARFSNTVVKSVW